MLAPKKTAVISHDALLGTSFAKSKKAISSIVAVALFVVITITAVVFFQTWYNSFSSLVLLDVKEENVDDFNDAFIESVVGDVLYLKNEFENLTITNIVFDGKNCNVNGSYLSGINEIYLGNCTDSPSNDVVNVVVITEDGVFTRYVYYDNSTS